jgi:ParB family transcriptional regulator, chromosome partitioning protein
MHLDIHLSRLVDDRKNPRKVKPAREAHRRLVALIRSQGLLQPLLVKPIEGEKTKRYLVIAGKRRLAALREIHQDGDPKIACVVRDVDSETASALSLGENFGREAMHPLDEAEAFAHLAKGEGKTAETIAADFGVTEHYVRQRMKLASLCDDVKAAYRRGEIDTATSEAFAAVPADKQREVWQETNGHPRHAEHVRNVIAHSWIDSKHALFDVATLPENAVSRDLFDERVLVERQIFLEAQSAALDTERQALIEEGWKEVVVGRREDVQDRLYAMAEAEPEYDKATTQKLENIAARKTKLEDAAERIDDGDETKLKRIEERYETLEAKEREIEQDATITYSEATKATATAFLILDPDGRVHREYRVPRRKSSRANDRDDGSNGASSTELAKLPTADNLSDKQLAVLFTHQALAVRQALLRDKKARKRILALLLHEKVHSKTLAIRHEPNGTTLHASAGDGFSSAAFDELQQRRAKLDPLLEKHHAEDTEAYEALSELPESTLDALIDLLLVEHLTAHMLRPTVLVCRLAAELQVDLRQHWRPDEAWLSRYQKIQLASLMAELRGPVYSAAHETRKKSELVQALAHLFSEAEVGTLEDKQAAARAKQWVPAPLLKAQ